MNASVIDDLLRQQDDWCPPAADLSDLKGLQKRRAVKAGNTSLISGAKSGHRAGSGDASQLIPLYRSYTSIGKIVDQTAMKSFNQMARNREVSLKKL